MDELCYCFYFTLAKVIGMEIPAWVLSEVAIPVQAPDWSGSKCRGMEEDSTHLVTSLMECRKHNHHIGEPVMEIVMVNTSSAFGNN